MDLGELKVRISADIASLAQGLQQAQAKMQSAGARMQSVGAGMTNVGKSMSLAVTAPILLMGKLGLDELKDIQAANAQTAAAIKRVGAGALISAEGIRAQAGALQKLSGMDDQAIQSGQNLLITQGNLNLKTKQGVAAFERASRVMVDYAAATGKEPVAAAKRLAKALADPQNALSRIAKEAGITKVQQEALKKQMDAVKDPAAKQAILLGALEEKYKGSAAAAGGTLSAKLAILKDRVAGISAAFLEKLIPAIDTMSGAASKLLTWVEGLSPQMQKWGAIMLVVAAAAGPVLIIVGSLVSAVGALLPVIAALLGPIGLIIVALVAFGVGLAVLWRENEAFRDGVKAAWDSVKTNVGLVLDSLRATMEQWIAWGRDIWAKHGEQIKASLTAVWDALKLVIEGRLKMIKGFVQTWLAIFRGDWSGAWDGIKTMLSGAWDTIKGIVSLALTVLKTTISAQWGIIKSATSAGWEAIKDAVEAKAKAIPGAVKGALSDLVGMMGDVGSKAGAALARELKDAVNSVLDRIRGIDLPSVKVAGKTIGGGSPFSGIPRLARGGVTDGVSFAGEAGPEAVIPLGSSPTNRADARRVMSEAGLTGSGLVQHFHISGAQVNPFALAQQAKFAMMGAGLA